MTVGKLFSPYTTYLRNFKEFCDYFQKYKDCYQQLYGTLFGKCFAENVKWGVNFKLNFLCCYKQWCSEKHFQQNGGSQLRVESKLLKQKKQKAQSTNEDVKVKKLLRKRWMKKEGNKQQEKLKDWKINWKVKEKYWELQEII